MHNVGRAAIRSLQRVVHRLRRYVRGLTRCVRLQAIAKTVVLWFGSKPAPTEMTKIHIKATRESSSASPDPFKRVYGQKLVRSSRLTT